MEIKKLTTTEALTYLKDIVPLSCIAKEMGVHKIVISQAHLHSMKNGKPYYLPADKVEKLHDAVQSIGLAMLNIKLSMELQDGAEKLQLLKENFLIIKNFAERMGKSANWFKQRMTNQPYKDRLGKERNYYNTFTEKDIADINNTIRLIALDILSIQIIPDYPEE